MAAVDSNVPAAPRAFGFLRFKRAKEPPQKAPPVSGPSAATAAMPSFVRRMAMLYGFTEGLLGLVRICIAAAVLIAIALFFAIVAVSRRPMVRVNAPPTLKALSQQYFQVEGLRFDQVATSIITILSLKHHVDDGGAPYFALLQGMVSPEIYRSTELALKKAIVEIRAKRIVQNLNITALRDFESDPKAQRVSCYVRGYIIVNGQQAGSSAVVPYRAEVLLEKTTPGNLNPLPYTLIRCIEKIKKDALAWDSQREKEAKHGD